MAPTVWRAHYDSRGTTQDCVCLITFPSFLTEHDQSELSFERFCRLAFRRYAVREKNGRSASNLVFSYNFFYPCPKTSPLFTFEFLAANHVVGCCDANAINKIFVKVCHALWNCNDPPYERVRLLVSNQAAYMVMRGKANERSPLSSSPSSAFVLLLLDLVELLFLLLAVLEFLSSSSSLSHSFLYRC